MSTTTQNLELVKPDGTEAPDIDVINDNMDIIDEEIIASRAWYATCSTAAGTAAKEAASAGFVLVEGATVAVRFANENTAANATLNVSGTGAKPIYANNSTTADNLYWYAGETVVFVYDGTNWRMTNSVGLKAVRESVSHGFISRNDAISPGEYISFDVTFSKAFASVPSVSVMCEVTRTSIAVDYVTQSGFTVYIRNMHTASITVKKVWWTAVA